MKKVLIAMILALAICTAASANKSMKNSPDGFRGIKWGDPISALGKTAQMVEENKVDETKFYIKTDEDLTLGGASLSAIAYVFWREQFATVMIRCKSPSEFEALKAVAVERFGTPVKPNRFIESYGWLDDNAFVSVSQNPPTMTIASMKLFKEQQVEREKKAKLGATTGF